MRNMITLFIASIVGASFTFAGDKSKEAAVLKFVSEKLAGDNEIWDFQPNPPKALIDIDTQRERTYRAYLAKEHPDQLKAALQSQAAAKYVSVLVFKNRAGTLYKVIHYSERDIAPCKNVHDIEFRNYDLNGGEPKSSNVVSGSLSDGGECPPTY